ncbi:MAG: ABC transporter substrate-binding protein [Corynebacterium glucuronolyticum]|nr:ABC transporter substrate-binding protein [Corynebacterium glucuronolyticum]MDD7586622.1 ABC transporter substrate-binding protein [Mycobacteriaceae bacterium]MDY5833734.1 ABC transporter substrate-binding protein [Corynebacterium glucuronolyticum]
MRRVFSRVLAFATVAALGVSLSGCSSDTTNSASPSTAAAESSAAFTFENCGHEITVNGIPQKVLLVNRIGVVPTLDALGVLSDVHMRAGAFAREYFSPTLEAKVEKIPNLTEKVDPTGHLQISKEEVVGTESDLIIGYAGNVDYTAMAGTGIPIIEEPGFCGGLRGQASWDDVWKHIRFYGKLFHKEAEAEKYVAETQEKLRAAEEKKAGEGLSVAVLYPSTDGSVNYAYGTTSMSHPIVTSAGMKNVFADTEERVFEVTDEELIARNPDVIISLYSVGGQENADRAVDGVKKITGINETTAGKTGAILPMLLYFAEPPSGLSIQGLEQLNTFLENR